MKIKKIICLFALVFALCLASCTDGTKLDMDSSGNVESNGGFAVTTGNYVYFVNGVESYSTEYKTGEVVKGALMRTKKENFAKLGTEEWKEDLSETVVSKLIVSSDYTAGFYVYGDYVYYAVPSTEKDTTGKLKNSKLNFFMTKLDGTSTSKKIADKDFGNSAQFRYISSGEKVYLAVYETALYVYDTASCKQVYAYDSEKEPIDELIFDDGLGADVYFTIKPINTNLYDKDSDSAKQASYQDLYKYTLGEENPSLVLSGVGKYAVGENHELVGGDGVSLTGATIDLFKHIGGYLYFSYTSLDSTVGETVYVRLKDGKTAWADKEVLNGGDKNASAIFADGSYYKVDGESVEIYFISSDKGLLKYDYKKNSLLGATAPDGDFGVTTVYYSSDITSCTILGFYGNYLYLYDASGNYFRVDIANEKDVRINKHSFTTSWYNAEVITISGKQYLIGSYSDGEYNSYVYAIDVDKAIAEYDALSDDDKAEYFTSALTADEYKGVKATLLGKTNEDDQKTYEEKLEELEK